MVESRLAENVDKSIALLKEDKYRQYILEIQRTNGSKQAILAFINILTDYENCDQEIARIIIELKDVAEREGDVKSLSMLIDRLQNFRRDRYGSQRTSGTAAIEIKTEGRSTVRIILDEVEKRLDDEQRKRDLEKDVIDVKGDEDGAEVL